MTITGWVLFICMSIFIVVIGAGFVYVADNLIPKIIAIVVSIILIFATFMGITWYFNNTESGRRALVDQNSELNGGLERTVTIYTADGNVIAQYSGKIDIEGNDGGYVLFDFNGKRYTYYNCFVESIADIDR